LRQIKDSNHNRNGRPKRTHSNESKGDYQRDDPGLRIGQRARSPESAKWLVGGASIFRGRMSQIQAEAGHWEKRIGTVHDFRVMLLDNDTCMFFTIVFDGDFKADIKDILVQSGRSFIRTCSDCMGNSEVGSPTSACACGAEGCFQGYQPAARPDNPLFKRTQISQPLAQLIRIREANRVAAAEMAVSRADLKKAETEVALQVHTLYFGILIACLQKTGVRTADRLRYGSAP
jgi:hypothetical protein